MTLTFGVDTPCRNHRGDSCPACHGSGFTHAVARNTDPATSHEAAASLTPDHIRRSQAFILGLLIGKGPMTDARLVELARHAMSESGARTRRSELVRDGLVVDSGKRETLVSGRKAVVWMAV